MLLNRNAMTATRLHYALVACVLLFVSLTFLSFPAACAAAPLTIVDQGKSSYSIVIPQIPAVSVSTAAGEMQRCFFESTSVTLPIRKDNETFSGPFISLGSTQQAHKAGISASKIPDEGFRIVTNGANLYILGLDTTTENFRWQEDMQLDVKLHPEIPGPAFTKNGGFSNGTANGVYTFLENQLGMRWLFPGDLGRDVPERAAFTVEPMDYTEVPQFNYRFLAIVRDSQEWKERHKLGYSFRIRFTHNFEKTVPRELYKEHPEWFAMNASGQRPEPPERTYKLETTNPELVEFFAKRAIESLKSDPASTTYSLSPSDGRDWSLSPESKALYDPTPQNANAPSVTPLVLKFYRDVSALVEKELPGAYTGGFLYQDFSYPPAKGGMELPKNFIPVLVGKSMGFSFYNQRVRDIEVKFMQEWAKVAPENWYYYGMPTWLRESSGMVTPAAADELNFLYGNMLKANMKGAFIYGTYMWSQGALVNYVNAKMLWNPAGDARQVQRDFLTRAYGPEAGAVMERLYNKLDESWWSDYFRSPQSTHYNVSEVMYRNTFGAHYPEMEKLFLEADAQPMTDKQKQRLDLIKQNMIVLQWRLRNAGHLPSNYSSPLSRTSQQIFDLMTDDKTYRNFSYILVPRSVGANQPEKVQIAKAPAAVKLAATPNSRRVLIYPTQDGEVALKPSILLPSAGFIVYYITDQKSKTVKRGFLVDGEEITFPAKANQSYYLSIFFNGIAYRPRTQWKIEVPGAAPAQANFHDGTLYLESEVQSADLPKLLVHVPQATNWQIAGGDSGVVIQTESNAIANRRLAAVALRDTEAALKTALERYQAGLVQNFDHKWKFSPDADKTGEASGFFKADFDDSAWKTISAIGPWQSQGFTDYQGTAWYRRSFNISQTEADPLAMGDKRVLLFFGAVDGDAEFYLNGQKIGQHVMSNYSNGWEVPIVLDITPMLHAGKSTLAVKVTKNRFVGGLYRGVSLLSGVLPE